MTPPLRLVEKAPPPNPPPVRVNVEVCRAPYGRSQFFNLRPCDLSELMAIAERMERRR